MELRESNNLLAGWSGFELRSTPLQSKKITAGVSTTPPITEALMSIGMVDLKGWKGGFEDLERIVGDTCALHIANEPQWYPESAHLTVKENGTKVPEEHYYA